ncbi:peptidoglycan editing factor PgeF [Dyadobacter fanqingshengii]|uniref:Purine nucleoside phosphorylase n=1 Tax=Dyadobacter fanqingshengii TaxID=2906443 RepID=A0A9X1P8W7_9BACT|nr:peptidoglycan editing factor PgeF [Dyadobacter fanqingshengii]MCF0039293.1 peptidoglycan editing factor PgeF [Dyadobacter fanqingshengii]USJ33890.1 peptidoglycan editing factor PgeF [Dyadobacter fanqingshengii]
MSLIANNAVKPLFRVPEIFSRFNGLIAAESTRHGGVSKSPYGSLNLGGSQDDPALIMENNRLFFNALNVPFETVAKSHQVHEDKIINVQSAGRFEGYDALVTNKPNIQLAVTVADCTPILIFDPLTRSVAAIHAGWRGTVTGIVTKTVAMLQTEFGADPKNCVAYVGTCIDECSFEVGEDVSDNFEEKYKRFDVGKQKYYVDLKAANRDQLITSGLSPENIQTSAYSTVLHNDDYFSYRLEKGFTGRMLATIGLVD